MGCIFSGTSSSPSSTANKIRVVHLNGYVEEFDHPVSVGQLITGSKPPKTFICTPSQLLSNCSKPELKPEKILEPGHVYFLLPYSTLQTDVSPVGLASLTRKLTKRAKSCKFSGKFKSEKASHGGGEGEMQRKKMMMGCRAEMGPRLGRSWRPVLDTIRERSFNRRSESDLQEIYAE